MIYGLGMLDSGLVLDYGQLVMDNEFAKMIRRIVQGVDFSDAEQALDIVKEIGPGGDFLSHPDTFKHFKTGTVYSDLFNRMDRQNWLSAGGQTFEEKADEKVDEILKTHQVYPMPEGASKKIRTIVEDSERYIAEKKAKK